MIEIEISEKSTFVALVNLRAIVPNAFHPVLSLAQDLLICSIAVGVCSIVSVGQSNPYPHNAVDCERCHNTPAKFGGSAMIVERVGYSSTGRFVPAFEGGIHHRHGESNADSPPSKQIRGKRVSLTLLGDGYVEAIDSRDIEQNAKQQRGTNLGIAGVFVNAPVFEGNDSQPRMQVGRFGWKSQHSSLMSSCADSLRNELGIRNALYPNEYSTHTLVEGPTPFDVPNAKTHKTELESFVKEIRRSAPPSRDGLLAASSDARAGERLFTEIGCGVCHVSTYRTLRSGTRINAGTYRIPKFIGDTVLHPYSDFLLHDVGTGDGIPEAARPEYLDQSTANKFRTPPLWGLRFRSGLMHDGDSPGADSAIARHNGEAVEVRNKYDRLTPNEKKQLQQFLKSL